MNELPQLSASQVSTFRDCARKWAFSYIELRKPPAHPSAELGTKIHAELETWLKSGTLPTHPAALAGVPHAPAPGVPWVEHAFTLELPASPFRGFIDVLYDLEGPTAVPPFRGDTTVIHDWKSSSDPKKWAKTPEQLRTDVQSNLYAGWAFSRGAGRVQGRWVYLATKGLSVAHPVHLLFDRSQVQDQLGLVNESAQVIQRLYSIRPKTSELPPTRESCGKFGGCPYRSDCPQSMEDLFGGEKTVTNPYASFMQDVDTRFPGQAGAPAPVPPPIYAQPPAPIPVPVQMQQAQVPPARPAHWIPGDPLNDIQKYLIGIRASNSMIADAATTPPLPEVSQTFNAYPAFTDNVRPEGKLFSPAEAQAIVASVSPPAPVQPAVYDPRYDPATFARPPVEAGFINPPESAGMQAPAQPSEMMVVPATVNQDAPPAAPPDDLDAMGREQLKALGIAIGAFDSSCRRQEPWMRDEIRKFRKLSPAQQKVVAVLAPVVHSLSEPPAPVPPPVAWVLTPAEVVQPPPVLVTPGQAEYERQGGERSFGQPWLTNIPETKAAWETEAKMRAEQPELFKSHCLQLFVNCSPKHYTGLYFADVLKAVMPKVRELTGVPDYRMVDYGKGAGVLANTVRTYLLELQAKEPLDALVVDARTPEGGACLSALEELATNVTRGF